MRYALDFARLVDGQAFVGDPEHHASWHGFGQPVLAAADGTVVSVRDDLAEQPVGVIAQGEGNAIVLDIGGGRYVVLEHLQQGSALVRPGQSVARGQWIASVGNTGESLSPHLHVQIQDRPSDPDAVAEAESISGGDMLEILPSGKVARFGSRVGWVPAGGLHLCDRLVTERPPVALCFSSEPMSFSRTTISLSKTTPGLTTRRRLAALET